MAESFGQALRRLRRAAGLTQLQLAQQVHLGQSDISRYESDRQHPDDQVVHALEQLLAAGGRLARTTGGGDDGNAQALELVRRAGASDLGGDVLDLLEAAFDTAATDYCAEDPAVLLPQVAEHLDHVQGLLDASRKTLAEHRRLVGLGGWLALLRATLHIDLNEHARASAWLRSSAALARHAGDDEALAWCFETDAWRVLNTGDFRTALRLATAALEHAPAGGSAEIQATVQLARVQARLGAADATYRHLESAHVLSARKGVPVQAEHHYRFDPAKTDSFTATTLAWLGDDEAERSTRRAVEMFAPTGTGPNPRARRYAAAQMDLALISAKKSRLDEAAAAARAAIDTGQVAPSNWWRIAEVVSTVTAARSPAAPELQASYQDMLHR
ncbi:MULTISPECIES: helix-turn-helix transcriptional regulator [unclassified Saccharopolyspora]|uniref:helix-turn-helix domain-containing protein n=1 Tax=unclassified Saccharopolyspora TaxID=2646250 RepID=UPI001CD50774|nr:MULTISPECIES: helix-turn-helix transcriptional regulator [unclassified Saccharopolyspora]MCA1192121.1 helix-turn-helix domain-containing protein [Saccharopolyspora sp. 6V]MCA1229216.1 helix-turn-helix domain-containing protein [Saccharopolyspora sp. 6M]